MSSISLRSFINSSAPHFFSLSSSPFWSLTCSGSHDLFQLFTSLCMTWINNMLLLSLSSNIVWSILYKTIRLKSLQVTKRFMKNFKMKPVIQYCLVSLHLTHNCRPKKINGKTNWSLKNSLGWQRGEAPSVYSGLANRSVGDSFSRWEKAKDISPGGKVFQ